MRILMIAVLLAGGCQKREVPATAPVQVAQVADADSAFWRWFVAHKEDVAAVRRADDPAANELAAELHKVDGKLTFELGVGTASRELIISADGNQQLFPTVKRLVAAAPAILGWKVIAFRPRKAAGFAIELGDGTKVGGEGLRFSAQPAGDKLDIELYVAGRTSIDDNVKRAVFLLLDAALGEYDVETRLAGIDILPGTKAPAGARPFGELARVVDARK
jgi:hypothetical protein